MVKEQITGDINRKYKVSNLEIQKKLKLLGEIVSITQSDDGLTDQKIWEIKTVEKKGE